MKYSELSRLTQEARVIVAEVAEFIYQELGKVKTGDIVTKNLNSLVSYVDRTAEKQLVKDLGSLIPSATFLTEEETVKHKEGQYQWIIDPLDGTTNYLHQIPFFAISVALQHKGAVIMGIVYEVNRQECFYAWKSGGAWLNDDPIGTSKTKIIQESLLATGFPYYDFSRSRAYLEVLEFLMKNTRGIRRIGAAALDLAYVACGRFDGFFEYSLNPWDVAAGAFIIQEAGGKVCDFTGGDNYLFGGEIIASNSSIFDELRPVIIRAFAM